MIEKKGRPESRQKKAGPETDDGRASSETDKKSAGSKKWSVAPSSTRLKSAKSSVSNVKADKSSAELDKLKSSMNLERENTGVERKKSATGRKKSAIRMSEVGRAVAVRKFIGKCKTDKTDVEEERVEKPRNVKIWDEKLEELALRKKRVSVIDREIGLKHIRVIPATPAVWNVAVKKRIGAAHSNLSMLVMKTASPDAELIQPGHMGPRYDALGKIIPHSILGDVKSFLKHSRERTKESNILLVHPVKSPEVEIDTEEGSEICNTLLSEENALKTWKGEMEVREQQQSRLAGLLKCKKQDLLMCRSEGHCEADKQMMLNKLRYHDSRHDPAVCFWKIGDTFTAGQIQETLTKSAKGRLPTPVVSGDADSIIREKGKMCNVESDICMRDEYLQQKARAVQGTIQIANKVLFNELQLQGEGLVSEDLYAINNARGDNKEQTKGVKFVIDSNGMEDVSKKEEVQNSGKNVGEMMKHYSEQDDACGLGGYEPNTRRRSVYQHLIMADRMSRVIKDRRIFDFKFIGQEKEELDGPAMQIDGTILQWCCNGFNKGCNCDTKLFKEVFVLIKGEAKEVIRGYAKLENIGTTRIKYSWMRVPEKKPLPVPRPRRHCFYFMDDDGIVLPRETVYVPMLFRSPTPGYFTESWLLSTQPLLEGGAKVKFTFKGIARYVPDLSRQFQEIEDYLAKKQTETLCSLEAKALLEYAVVKASLEYGKEREDPVVQTAEEIFMQTNPGLYYHAHVIGRLQLLCESFIPEPGQRKLESGVLIVSVPDLWKAFLSLPDDDTDDSDDESYVNLTRKQTLLWQLYRDISILCFQPLLVLQSSYKSKYIMMYTMLQTGIDSVVGFAHVLAKTLGLVPVKEVKEEDSLQKQGKGNKNKAKASTKTSKGGKKDQSSEAPVPGTPLAASPEEQQQEVLVFSAAHKYRTENVEKSSPKLIKYDEKVYIEVYGMLKKTVEDMSVLFEDL